MSSVSPVEIIDLTGPSSPHDPETQEHKLPKDNAGADVDAEKSAKRARRKRKNGESSRTRTPVESRAASPEREPGQIEDEVEVILEEDTKTIDTEPVRKRKRKSKKSGDKSKEASPPREDTQQDSTGAADDAALFFIDTAPTVVPTNMVFEAKGQDATAPLSSNASEVDKVPLLLPRHVSVLATNGDLPVQIIEPVESDSDADSYIEYLDYNDRLAPDMPRYFQEERQTRFLCKRCGAENEHRTHECPVLICLTCGARDEHSTRSCPISKTCFNCGMKGHINKDCPNRRARGMMNAYDDCDRCGSDKHNTNECPTIWRLYEYVDDRERETILLVREEKQTLSLGEGGEGYIARDEWCYNCGSSGHLGDDCNEMSRPHDTPSAPSAFGLYNTLSGPFSDASTEPVPTRAPRDWESGNAFGDGWGTNAPTNVGKRARARDRDRLAQRARELEAEDDADDWFDNPRNVRGRGMGGGGSGAGKKDTKIRIGRAWKSDDPLGQRKPSLLERLQDDPGTRERDRDRNKGRDRDRDRDRNRDGGEKEPGLSILGSASRKHSSRHDGDRGYGDRKREERRGSERRWDESRSGDRERERHRDHDRDRSRARGERDFRPPSRDDRGPRGPQYRGGYAR